MNSKNDDPWKSSKFRVIIIAIGIFLLTYLTMHLNNIPNKVQGSLVLSLGYVIGTIILSIAKKIWIKHYYK